MIQPSLWGHQPGCACTVCLTLPRILQLSGQYTTPALSLYLGDQLRLLEAHLRDHLVRSQAQGSVETPKGFPFLPSLGFPPLRGPLPFIPGPPPPAPAQLHPAQQTKETTPDKPATSRTLGPSNIGLSGKAQAAQPPGSLAPSTPVKTEETGETKENSPRGVVDAVEKTPERKGEKKEKKKKKRSRSRSRRKAEDKRKPEEGRARSPKQPESEGRDRSPSRKRREKRKRQSSSEDRRERGGEERASSSTRRPKEPDYPPRESQRGKGKGGRKGPGWIGEIPYSNHPRWTASKNRGIVKRAKQELYNRGKGGHRK